MIFQVGDTVIHPGYGAGRVVKIRKLNCLGSNKLYYSIELSDDSRTNVWIPVQDAEARGVRPPTPKSQLDRVWRVLRAGPEALSTDHEERYGSLQEKLCGGDIFRIAEAVRDLYWKEHRVRRLTITGTELYNKGFMLLTSEVAAMQGCELGAAKAAIAGILGASLAAEPALSLTSRFDIPDQM
ncbi:MAG: CarD family transcriptional regulator [Anaerolineae bacterium]